MGPELDTAVDGVLFAEAGVWVGICRYMLFPLLTLQRRLEGDVEVRTGAPYVPKDLRMGLIMVLTGLAFLGVAYWQGVPLREALPAGWGAVGFAIAAFKTEEGMRERLRRDR